MRFCRTSRGEVEAAGIKYRYQAAVTEAGSCGLSADSEFADVTFGVVPAITPELRTIFLPTAVELSFVPVLHEAAKAAQTMSPCPTVLTVVLASVNLLFSHLPCMHVSGTPRSGQPDGMPESLDLGLLPPRF